MTLARLLRGDIAWHVEQADVREGLARLPDGCVQTCITSPPYFGLRAYGTNPQTWGGNPRHEHAWMEHRRPGTTGGPSVKQDSNRGARTSQGWPVALCPCGAWRGELGAEPTPDLYVAHLVEVFAAVRRVLHPTATLWVNLGDSFNGSGKGAVAGPNSIHAKHRPAERQGFDTLTHPTDVPGLAPLNRIGVPWKFAFAMQADGWILRQHITWVKTSSMPESVSGWRWERCRKLVKAGNEQTDEIMARLGVNRNTARGYMCGGVVNAPGAEYESCPGCPRCADTDGYVLRKGSGRPTSATEDIFLFARGPGYYYDTEAVKTANTAGTVERLASGPCQPIGANGTKAAAARGDKGGSYSDPSGANARNYLILGPEPLGEAHFAAFPTAVPSFCIKAGSSERGVCRTCLAPWARVVERGITGPVWVQNGPRTGQHQVGDLEQGRGKFPLRYEVESRTLGWRRTCRHDGEPIPSLVLDPFSGSGRTGVAATRLGRRYLGLELNQQYTEMSERQIEGDAPLWNWRGGAP